MTALERWPGTWLLQHKGCAHVAIILQQGIRSLDFLEFGSSGHSNFHFSPALWGNCIGPEITWSADRRPEFWPLQPQLQPQVLQNATCGGQASSKLLWGGGSPRSYLRCVFPVDGWARLTSTNDERVGCPTWIAGNTRWWQNIGIFVASDLKKNLPKTNIAIENPPFLMVFTKKTWGFSWANYYFQGG